MPGSSPRFRPERKRAFDLSKTKGAKHGIDFRPDLPYAVGQMAKPDSLGQFEQLVLTAILALREDAYGVTIHSKVQDLAQPKAVSLGAVYVTLDRLEDKGLVASWMSDPTPERGGRAKRCYRLEALGERALQESAVTAKRIWDVIAEVWGKEWARKWGKRWGKEAG
jgi:PadR family transcriptional regulator, regulatory protein PadR